MTDIDQVLETDLDANTLRKFARAFWRQQWRSDNPDATMEEEKAAWAIDKKKHMIHAKRALRWLETQGVLVSIRDASN
ncbi:MAG: hypothetical protein KDA67_08745 [Rhodobacteraceae bacterium]|nr:hypothetical protein [Paracoccaceae bacterium]